MAKRATTVASRSQIKPAQLRAFHRALADWYRAHGRHDLPWRNTDDPYPIWLSEVMLQQTQVATVRDRFYGPFLQRFPTIEALAAAPSEAVMKAWEGLGYYSRARNLHKAAQQICFEGEFLKRLSHARVAFHGEPQSGRGQRSVGGEGPPSIEQLLSLPGIGRNTASAILAFAYHQPVAILEANVKRIIARVFAFVQPTDTELWEGAEALLNRDAPFDYNQAMMDVGALICTPKHPNCPACPANTICRGQTAPERYPAPKAKKQIPTREVTILVREEGAGRLFLEARDSKLLGGLYGFPQSPHTPPPQRKPVSRATTAGFPLLSETTAFAGVTMLGVVTHTYSHFKLIGHVVYERVAGNPNSSDWYSRKEIVRLPLSKLDHKVLALVENCHSAQKKRSTAKPSHGRR